MCVYVYCFTDHCCTLFLPHQGSAIKPNTPTGKMHTKVKWLLFLCFMCMCSF